MPQSAIFSTTLDVAVNARLRGLIWADDFVEFSHLNAKAGGDTFTATVVDGALQLQAASKPKAMSFNDWLKAFLMYASVYLQRYPGETINILKYADTIRDLHASGARWAFYDDQFRRLRANTKWPWQQPHMELWGKAMVIFPEQNKGQSFTPKHAETKKNTIPPGYCWPFHEGRLCKGQCGFNHRCYKCRGPHRANKCYQQGKPRSRPPYPNRR